MYEFYGYQGTELRVEDVYGEDKAFTKGATTKDGLNIAVHFISKGLNHTKYRKARKYASGNWRLYHDNGVDYVEIVPDENGEAFKDERHDRR